MSNNFNEKDYLISSADYGRNFCDLMRGRKYAEEYLHSGVDKSTGGYALPSDSHAKLEKAIGRESLFRNMATVMKAYGGASRIFAKDCNDLAEWVAEEDRIPLQDAIGDFTRCPVNSNKLAVFVKLDDDFVSDAAFSLEDYLTERLAKNFAKAEDRGFVLGTGKHMPFGILDDTNGAETGTITALLCFDDILRLYHSLDADYRKNAVWLMNDETALTLRTLKDSAGSYLWDPSDNTILGKPVMISTDMPSVGANAKPVAFGDFSYYWIIDRSPISLRTLKEQFVTLDQVGYLAMKLLDGRLIRREAVKVLQIAEAVE